LACQPRVNHWWHVPLYLHPRGLTTGAMPFADGVFAIDFDFLDHRLAVQTSLGRQETLELASGSMSRFYAGVRRMLEAVGVKPAILARPFDESKARSNVPFEQDVLDRPYDRDSVSRYFRLLSWIEPVFQKFRGRFLGKSTTVHLFWHSMDLALTRFSGRKAPEMPGADPVTKDAYSHEVISFGFWAGDPTVPEPAFYSYTAPEPEGLAAQPLAPVGAAWVDTGASHLALYRYSDLRAAGDPRASLLTFLESAYQAGAHTAGWDEDELRYRPAYAERAAADGGV
jgi:hypothetical protein